MENCPFTGVPCPHTKHIHVSDIENYTAKNTKDMCIFCGVPFIKKEGGGMYNTPNPIYEILNILIKGPQPQQPIQSPICSCGCTLNDIAKTGKIGCPNCYEVFKNELSPLIMSCQNSLAHKGKIPKRSQTNIILQLEEQLKRSITEEDYTTAARLRDEIKLLRGK